MHFNFTVGLLLSVCLVSLAGCSDNGSSPTSPTSFTGLNLGGAWVGNIGGTNEEGARATWAATQSGASVSGPFTASFSEGDSAAVVTITGTMTGTVSGDQLTSTTITFATGSIPGVPACSFSGTGTQAITASSIGGTMAMVFAAPCVGNGDGDSVSQTPTDTFRLSLTK